MPITFNFSFAPPFEKDLWYEITYGHRGSPVSKVSARVRPEVLEKAYDDFLTVGGGAENGRKFIRTVMDIPESDERGAVESSSGD